MRFFKRIKELEEAVSQLSAKVAINKVRIKANDWLDNVTVKFENKSPHINPYYAKEGDSGFDLRAWIKEDDEGVRTDENGNRYILMFPLERRLIRTGIKFELPQHCEAQVRPRSGCSLKVGLSVLNSPGTVDLCFRGEVSIIAVNVSNDTVTVTDGDRIAQCVICPALNSNHVHLEEVEAVDTNTDRGEGGIGHTGTK